MRISDWSSDVCSSDLSRAELGGLPPAAGEGMAWAAGVTGESLKNRSDSVLRLAAPLRSLAQRFAYLLLLAAALGIMLMGKTDPQVFERARMAVTDAVAPILDALSRPAATVARIVEEVRDLAHLRNENAALRAEDRKSTR